MTQEKAFTLVPTGVKAFSAMKTGILLVAFGTSEPKARCAFDNITKLAKERFKGTDIRWAYTSKFIQRKLAMQGKAIDSPMAALSRMHDEGFTHVAVQSLHFIAGNEYDKLKEIVAMFRHGSYSFEAVALGKPLLASYDDVVRVGKALLKEIPKERARDEAVVLMGHGSRHHPADLTYVAAAAVFHHMDRNVFLGTIEGHPSFDTVVRHCNAAGIKKAWLMPFMLVAGEHARNDMASDHDDSWKSVLTREGIKCIPVLKGMGEYDGIVDIWMDHLEEALSSAK